MAHVTLADLQAYIGTDETGTFIEECLDAGKALVNNYVGDAEVPSHIHFQAELIAASNVKIHRGLAYNNESVAIGDLSLNSTTTGIRNTRLCK